jgi:hypothetical protein
MVQLKFKALWAVDIYINGNFVQVNTFKYKRDAIKDATKYGKFEIVKRKVITDKY